MSEALSPVKFRVGPVPEPHTLEWHRMVYVEERLQRDGSQLWVITRGGAVLSRLGDWEYEPIPSSRSDEFIARTRWPDLEIAAAAATAALARESAGLRFDQQPS